MPKKQFTLSAEENKRAEAWRKSHVEENHKHSGGYYSWTYKFTLTGVGTQAVIACSCGEEEDVSEYEKW